ncbi:slc38a7, partial [Symbiodinium necroappetens]
AVRFQTDSNGQEKPVGFHGLVGKSFRPPELHDHKPYLATKVDSWCLGWSTFYLLTAQPLFMSADPALKDTDWQLFKSGKFDELFKTKSPNFSPTGIDFIFKLLQFEPSKRMSIADA